MYEEQEPLLNGFYEADLPVPTLTRWDPICKCCCFYCNYVSSMQSYFINHWMVHCCPGIFVIILTIISATIYGFFVIPYLPFSSILVHTLIFFFAIMFLVSYMMVIIEGPGYLPFYYPMELNDMNDPSAKYLSGVVSNMEQEAYVKSQPKLKRAGYFNKAKRYVIRPDHFCGWTGTFIGKRNHKMFFHFNIWGSLYLFSYLILISLSIYNNVTTKFAVNQILICFPMIFTALPFVFMTIAFTVDIIHAFSKNQTQFERMQYLDTNYSKGSCLANWEEVCGPSSKWYCWLIPYPPFQESDPVLYQMNAL